MADQVFRCNKFRHLFDRDYIQSYAEILSCPPQFRRRREQPSNDLTSADKNNNKNVQETADATVSHTREGYFYIGDLSWWVDDLSLINVVQIGEYCGVKFFEFRANGAVKKFCEIPKAFGENIQISNLGIKNRTLTNTKNQETCQSKCEQAPFLNCDETMKVQPEQVRWSEPNPFSELQPQFTKPLTREEQIPDEDKSATSLIRPVNDLSLDLCEQGLAFKNYRSNFDRAVGGSKHNSSVEGQNQGFSSTVGQQFKNHPFKWTMPGPPKPERVPRLIDIKPRPTEEKDELSPAIAEAWLNRTTTQNDSSDPWGIFYNQKPQEQSPEKRTQAPTACFPLRYEDNQEQSTENRPTALSSQEQPQEGGESASSIDEVPKNVGEQRHFQSPGIDFQGFSESLDQQAEQKPTGDPNEMKWHYMPILTEKDYYAEIARNETLATNARAKATSELKKGRFDKAKDILFSTIRLIEASWLAGAKRSKAFVRCLQDLALDVEHKRHTLNTLQRISGKTIDNAIAALHSGKYDEARRMLLQTLDYIDGLNFNGDERLNGLCRNMQDALKVVMETHRRRLIERNDFDCTKHLILD